MVNAKVNKNCEEVKTKKIKECWTCECGKHHICKDGAEKCCTDIKSIECNCRHCLEKSKVSGGKDD